MLSAPYMTFTGRATNALPVPLAASVPPAISITGTENPHIMLPTPVTVVTSTITAPAEFGLFHYIAGIKPVVFPNATNEITEFFTFYSTASNVTDTPAGSYNMSSRTGTFTVYLGHGDFSNPATFQSGTPVLSATFNQQILVPVSTASTNGSTGGAGTLSLAVQGAPAGSGATSGAGGTSSTTTSPQLNLATGLTLTSTSTATITSSSPFTYGGTCYQFGATGQKLTISSVGQFDSGTGPSANLNGLIRGSM